MTALVLAPDYDTTTTHKPDPTGLQPACTVTGFGLTADIPVSCWECRSNPAPGHTITVSTHRTPILNGRRVLSYGYWYTWTCTCGATATPGSRWSHTVLALESGIRHA